ncbi:MAG: hypothetical protein N3A69_15640, partial [Leptospiraceae bacterium]|nr:hypothetical protein [Leptospiraceae bacterium]
AVAIYARVSPNDPPGALLRQIEYLKNAVQEKGARVYEICDVASALDERIGGVFKLIELASFGKIRKIYIANQTGLLQKATTRVILIFSNPLFRLTFYFAHKNFSLKKRNIPKFSLGNIPCNADKYG